MAVDISSNFGTRLPTVFRWTLGTSNTVTQFTLPRYVKKISIRFETNAGYFSFDPSLTDGGAIGTHRGTVDADAWLELNMAIRGIENTARTSIFLGSATGSTVVQVLVEG